MSDLEYARKILYGEEPKKIVVEEPAPSFPSLDPLTFILLLPFLPLYLLFQMFSQSRPRLTITEIERTPTGYRILEYSR